MKIPVAEIFASIQGEGANVGQKTIFVRVTGCDFKCSWCDSKFSWRADERTEILEPEELAERLVRMCTEKHISSVVLTGGNPCLYDFEKVVRTLHDNGISVDVETQGSRLPEWLKRVDTLVISPKAPSSGQPDVYDNVKNWFLENEITFPLVAFKIPVFTEADFSFAERYYSLMETIMERKESKVRMYLSVGNTNTYESGDISKRVLADYKKLIDKVMASEMNRVYVLPQVHTLVYGNKQGV